MKDAGAALVLISAEHGAELGAPVPARILAYASRELRRRIIGEKRLPDVVMLDHRFGAMDDDTPAAVIFAVDSGLEYLAHETTLWITKLFSARN